LFPRVLLEGLAVLLDLGGVGPLRQVAELQTEIAQDLHDFLALLAVTRPQHQQRWHGLSPRYGGSGREDRSRSERCTAPVACRARAAAIWRDGASTAGRQAPHPPASKPLGAASPVSAPNG